MRPTAKSAFTTAALAALLFLAGCGDSNDGPAEQAGETVDEAAEETEEAAEDAANEAQDSAEEAGDEIEEATD